MDDARAAGADLRGLGGLLGPAAFITCWAVGGLLTDGYSPIDDAISRLAAVGADTRWLMSSGFVLFTIGLVVFASALRHVVAGPAWIAAGLAGVTTFGVALTPLDRSDVVDDLHGVVAGLGYVALAATPLLAARPLLRAGHRSLGWSAVLAGSVAAVCLALTPMPDTNGLFQRSGLTSADLWLAACGVAIARGQLTSSVLGAPGRD